MNENIEWRIPPSMPNWIEKTPLDRPVVLLLRHSVRGYLPPRDAGYNLPITEDGIRLARELGGVIGNRLKSLHASPILRCVQTAKELRVGAGVNMQILEDRHLGDPGVFVMEGGGAISNWIALEHEGVMRHLVSEEEALPGMAKPETAARFLVQHMLAAAKDIPGLHVFVTHDSLVTATAARILGKPLGKEDWPWYLEGAFFWKDQAGISVAYREYHDRGFPEPLCGLKSDDVLEFARREVALTVGLDSKARFFMAGGAFKTLVTGLPPRDLDLWAASAEDRALLISTLERKGARRLPDRPFGELYEISDRIVEIPHKVEPPTLSERLGRFDIALSAVGVEHKPEDQWSVNIHPLAQTSVERREVLLLKPLVNRNFILTTIERMRRYAIELDYKIPAEEEAAAWQAFEMHPPEKRAELINRFSLTGRGGFNVAEEAACRYL